MFFDTLVMAEAVKLAHEYVGPMGQYLEKPEHASVALYTHNACKFWYGDLPDTTLGLKEVAKGLGEILYVIPELSMSDDRLMHEQAVLEIAP